MAELERDSPTENGKPSTKGIGRQSSIGDVKTLRTRLQHRRESLNEEIEKENRMKKGSKKLIGASVDHKIRDQAALEMNFAESKIRVLQAELTKINSSIQAYQADGTQDTQIPIIPLALKTTTKINFVTSFTETISKHYHRDPSELEEAIYKFQELRSSLSSLSRDDTGVELLYQYYNQLQLVSRRLLHSRIRHGIAFIWYDAINGLPAGQQSVVFEKACMLFNLGALYSQVAAQQDRSTSEGIDAAVKYLEKAIGCFEYMKDKFSHSPTMDMTSEMLALFSDLMRAQAQEVLWEKEVLAGLQDNIPSWIGNAHRSKSVAECYRPIKELLDEDAVKEYIPDCWIAVIKIKEAHFKALAHYYAALTHESLATTYSKNGQIPEDVRTELHFLYTDTPQEVLSNSPKHHIGLMKAHLNCATLSHEYALKYNALCKDLLPVLPLYDMLEEASERTRQKRVHADNFDGIMVIAPTVLPADVFLTPVLPDFTAAKVQDFFHTLGPLPKFSGENSWSPPRTVILKKGEGGFGFCLRGSKPAVVSAVDEGGQAAIAGVNVRDWLLSVNDYSVRYLSHREVVRTIKEAGNEVTLEITTPVNVAQRS